MKNPERKISTTETTDDSGEFEVRPELRGEFDNLRWLEEKQGKQTAAKTTEPTRTTPERLKEIHAKMEEKNRRKADEARVHLAALKKPSDEAWRRQKRSELERDMNELREIMTQRPPSVADEEWDLFQGSCRRVLKDLEKQALRYSQNDTPAEYQRIQEIEGQIARLESYKFGRNTTARDKTKDEKARTGEPGQRELEATKSLLAKIEKLKPNLKRATLHELKEQKPLFWFLDSKRRIADKYFSPTFAPEGMVKEREDYEKAIKQLFPKTLSEFRQTCTDLSKLRKNAGIFDRYNIEELERAYEGFYSVDTSAKRQETEQKIKELNRQKTNIKHTTSEEGAYFPKPERD